MYLTHASISQRTLSSPCHCFLGCWQIVIIIRQEISRSTLPVRSGYLALWFPWWSSVSKTGISQWDVAVCWWFSPETWTSTPERLLHWKWSDWKVKKPRKRGWYASHARLPRRLMLSSRYQHSYLSKKLFAQVISFNLFSQFMLVSVATI